MAIVNVYGLADHLEASPNTLKKGWRQFPHFFIGQGRTLKGARFDTNDVIEYLKGEHYAKFRKINTTMDRKGSPSRIAPKSEKRIQNKIRCIGMGTQNKKGAYTANGDEFDLLSGIQ